MYSRRLLIFSVKMASFHLDDNLDVLEFVMSQDFEFEEVEQVDTIEMQDILASSNISTETELNQAFLEERNENFAGPQIPKAAEESQKK